MVPKRNQGRYCGETIDIRAVLEETENFALQSGWEVQVVCSEPSLAIHAYIQRIANSSRSYYVSAGIHGDEPAGTLALLEMFRQRAWPRDASLWIVPCLNPMGSELGTRENGHGIDLNRQYRNPVARETLDHLDWLQRSPSFDGAVFLHEDWEANGFYLYELNADDNGSLGSRMIESVRQSCPIQPNGPVDDWFCVEGVIRPRIKPENRPEWPEALYMVQNKTKRTFTLESPSELDMKIRVAAHVVALHTMLLTSPY